MIDLAREGIAIHVSDRIVFVNRRLIEMLGYENSAALVGKSITDLVQPARREISKQLEATMLTESDDLFSIEDVYECKSGQLLPVEVSAIPIRYQGAPAVQITARDISESKKVEAEIWEYQNMLKQSTSDLILAEEAQRRHLAIVLHDHLGQSLAMAKIKMAGLLSSTQDETLKAKLKAIETDITDAVKQTRSITYELSPPVLHELGLIEALEWRLEKIRLESDIETSYEHNLENIKLRNEQEVILFRSVDEILKNVTKHAAATKVSISTQATRYSFSVEVEDNGKGFDTSILAPGQRRKDSFGLFSIKERIEYLGGVLDIQSERGNGTKIILNVPVSLEGN
ncbi:MAG: PAS domain-containing sensor histidine kinase [Candidatus Marinimicrobia bacterium]|nr:PAS domain-containing sensor histidine kinase [Candidatus Neomarinimicrobiota bacterium]MBT3631393.1 PAS domain-containing sensor histidine kinase [Candidatus Neomarinimicrobiota bacterium]MBT3825392.1 PAS domain-containing sensor histidine kinase [Candidatus Neomarinimicrobiota bacterium]MBT4131493.1 PAS domain-containing sensor histidine kinase [Candidatus Neomarinimicrobiota bacterium]MBT4294820.1 PAS domain-containing sensor histidine kinase [Candidatus Neomarinimicrobiota bacterium]